MAEYPKGNAPPPPSMEPPPPYIQTQPGHGVPPPPGFTPYPQGYVYTSAQQGPITFGATPFFNLQNGSVPPTTTTVIVTQGFGPYPIQVTCTNCSANVLTETSASPGLLTWILSGTLLLVGCWLGCCLIPCCIPECQDIEHRCPNCKHHIGTYRRL